MVLPLVLEGGQVCGATPSWVQASQEEASGDSSASSASECSGLRKEELERQEKSDREEAKLAPGPRGGVTASRGVLAEAKSYPGNDTVQHNKHTEGRGDG